MHNKLTQDAPTLFIGHHGTKVVAASAQELAQKLGRSPKSLRKQYSDKRDGSMVWSGYIVGGEWFTAFKWAEVPMN